MNNKDAKERGAGGDNFISRAGKGGAHWESKDSFMIDAGKYCVIESSSYRGSDKYLRKSSVINMK